MSSPQYSVEGMVGPGANTLSWPYVFNRTYGLYGKNFFKYFRIGVVPAIVAYLCGYFLRILKREMLAGIPFQSKGWLPINLANGWLAGAVFWTISAFFLAAIAASFERMADDDAPAVADAYTRPRNRLGAIVAIALLTWTLFWLGRTLAGFVIAGFSRPSPLILMKNVWLTGLYRLLLLLLAGLISKFALAIPELMHDLTLSAGSVMKTSLQRTENWELFFMGFLIKSAIVGYGAYWITDKGLDWLWNHWTYSRAIFPWIERAVYIGIAAALESPLFIACSILSQELRAQPAATQDVVSDPT